jgi:signal peptide peptidase SppA
MISELDFAMPHRLSLDSPYLADYFGIWAMDEATFRAYADRCNGINLHAHINSEVVAKQVAARDKRSFAMSEDDGIAVIRIDGPMMKSVPSMEEGTSTVRIRQQIREARRDPAVRGAMLVLDTPGGTVKGNEDLVNDVAAFAAEKPIYAFIEDLTASAGVSVASQATKRFANRNTAVYGSMGTYAVLLDLSGRAEQLGIKVHVVKAGAYKGLGEPGTEIKEEQIAEVQRIVNAFNESYLAMIAKGLGKPVEIIRSLADGRVILASDAAAAGLIDGVQSYEQTYGQLVAATKATARTKPSVTQSVRVPDSSSLETKTMEKQPATLAELKATFPNSTAEWRESQLEAGASLSEAAISYAKHVEAKAAAEKETHAKELEKAKADAKAEAESAAKSANAGNKLGHQPLVARGQDADELDPLEGGDAIEDFNAAVAKIAGPRADLQRRQRAIRVVATQKPDLYKAYLLATNTGKRQERLINEKLEAVGSGK